MKKRFWTRLISAVLTMAMAFSILAVPASAAIGTESRRIVGTVNYNDEWTLWVTQEFLDTSGDEWEVTSIEDGENVPDYIYFGISPCAQADESTEVFWYTSTAWRMMYGANSKAMGANGVISVADGEDEETKIYPIAVDLDFSSDWATIEGVFVSTKEFISDQCDISDDAALEDYLAVELLYAQTMGTIYKGSIPEGGYMGLVGENKIFWYGKEQTNLVYEYMEDAMKNATSEAEAEQVWMEFFNSIDFDNGTIGILDEPIKPVVTTDLNGASIGASGSSADHSSATGNAVIIVAAAGAAVAAATGVYFYTHPEKVEEIKDFFADLSANVKAKVQVLTDNVKGAFGIVVDREEEEAEPAAETVAEAPAAA